MRDKSAEAPWKLAKRQKILESGFRLFSERGIESVTMPDVAEASGVPRATIYRYYLTKLELVVAIGGWKWHDYIASHVNRTPREKLIKLTAADRLRLYLDSYIDLYQNHKDILRFNYDFNSYLRTQGATEAQKLSYTNALHDLVVGFHELYEQGKRDGTLNTAITEEAMLSSSFHIMLSAVTRYAVGLLYVPETGTDPESELRMLEEMLLDRYTRQ